MEGRAGFATSSGWVEACLARCPVGTQPGSEVILELRVISEIRMKTAALWVGWFSCPKERRLIFWAVHSFPGGTVEQLRSWK